MGLLSSSPATQGSGSPSSSPPATQGSESPSSSSLAAQGTTSNESLEPVIPINRNENQPYPQERESIEKHIKETVTAIQQKIDKAIDVQATIDGVWHNQQIKLIDRWYDKIQWKGQDTWNNWLRSSEKKDKEEWKNLFKKQTFKEKKEYLTKVNAFLGPHLIHTKNPKVVFKNLECERQDAYKKIAEAAKKNLAFNSDADPKIIINQALQSLEEYKNKLNEVQKTLPDDTEKFHQRLREVFEAVWEEIEKDTKYKELVNLLNTILV